MATSFFILFESSSGYALFSVTEQEDISSLSYEQQSALTDFSRLQKTMQLVAFHPFESAENALENINAITEHEMTDDLRVSLSSF
jgi:nucleolar protein 56